MSFLEKLTDDAIDTNVQKVRDRREMSLYDFNTNKTPRKDFEKIKVGDVVVFKNPANAESKYSSSSTSSMYYRVISLDNTTALIENISKSGTSMPFVSHRVPIVEIVHSKPFTKKETKYFPKEETKYFQK